MIFQGVSLRGKKNWPRYENVSVAVPTELLNGGVPPRAGELNRALIIPFMVHVKVIRFLYDYDREHPGNAETPMSLLVTEPNNKVRRRSGQ